jgi:hypothetical protein
MNRSTTLSEIIEKTIKINNRFRKRSLEKKISYNFRKRHNSDRKKHGDLIKLDAAYKKL